MFMTLSQFACTFMHHIQECILIRYANPHRNDGCEHPYRIFLPGVTTVMHRNTNDDVPLTRRSREVACQQRIHKVQQR